MTKAKLYHLIKMHKPQYGIFAIDSLLADHGHTVLRLPPYHPDLNPIEQIWGIVKTRIAAINVTFKLRDVQQMAEQKCAAVTMEERAAVCRLLELWAKSVWVESTRGTAAWRESKVDDDDDNDDTSESTVSCDDNDDIQGDVPIVSDS